MVLKAFKLTFRIGHLCNNNELDIYVTIMWLFALNHQKKIYTQTETCSIYDDIIDLRVPSGCRRLLAIYERNQR